MILSSPGSIKQCLETSSVVTAGRRGGRGRVGRGWKECGEAAGI